MKSSSTCPLLILVTLLAACGPAAPAEPIAPADAVDAAATPPIHALIGHRAALELTSVQIAELDSIGDRLHRLNAPLQQELRDLPRRTRTRHDARQRSRRGDPYARPEPVVVRTTEFADPDAARELLEAMAEHNREARLAVRSVLTEEQQAAVCDVFSRPLGRRADRPDRTRSPTPWRWCEEEREAAADETR